MVILYRRFGQPNDPILKGQEIQEIQEILDFMILEDGITTTWDVIFQKNADLIQIGVEDWNHA